MERNERCIYWKSNTLGVTLTIPSVALESHVPTPAGREKRYCCDPLHGLASVLDIRILELQDTTYVNDVSPEIDSLRDGGVSSISLTNSHGGNELPNSASVIGLVPRSSEPSSHDVREVTRMYPPSEAFYNFLPDVGKHISSRTENATVIDKPGDMLVPIYMTYTISLKRRQRRHSTNL